MAIHSTYPLVAMLGLGTIYNDAMCVLCCSSLSSLARQLRQFSRLLVTQSPVSRALAKQMEEGGSVPEELLNHYTIITGKDGAGNFTQARAQWQH